MNSKGKVSGKRSALTTLFAAFFRFYLPLKTGWQLLGPVKLSVKVEYACRALAQIARLHGSGKLAQIENIARVEAIPANYLVQILSELKMGGLIVSRRGKKGGYALARPPDEISIYEVVKLLDGDVLDLGGTPAGLSGRRVRAAWQEIRRELETRARACTLDQLVVKSAEEMYYI
jgi:Rrf2 family transcriptional regulator, cysteine metabolism repressor